MYYSEFIRERQKELDMLNSGDFRLCGSCHEYAVRSMKACIIAATELEFMTRFGSTNAKHALDEMMKSYE